MPTYYSCGQCGQPTRGKTRRPCKECRKKNQIKSWELIQKMIAERAARRRK